MEILEAYDLTGSFRQAAVLVGCDHKTVAHWVAVREQTGGAPPARAKHRRRWRTSPKARTATDSPRRPPARG